MTEETPALKSPEDEIKRLTEDNEQLQAQLDERERALASLHSDLIRSLPAEAVVETIARQQTDALSYHLSKARADNQRLKNELKRLQDLLAQREHKIGELNLRIEELESQPAGNESPEDITELLSKDGMGELVDGIESESRPSMPRELRDLIKFLARHNRVKITDASVMLDLDKPKVKQMVDLLRRKNLVSGGVEMHSTVIASERLLKLSRKL